MPKVATRKDPVKRRQPINLGILPRLAGFILHRAEMVIFRDYKAATSSTGLTQAQFAVLEIVSCNSNVMQVELAAQLAMDKATMMVMVDRLETAGLLRRRASKIDRRRQELRLTPKGEEMLIETRRLALGHEASLFAHISPAEMKRLVRTLTKICAASEQQQGVLAERRPLPYTSFGLQADIVKGSGE